MAHCFEHWSSDQSWGNRLKWRNLEQDHAGPSGQKEDLEEANLAEAKEALEETGLLPAALKKVLKKIDELQIKSGQIDKELTDYQSAADELKRAKKQGGEVLEATQKAFDAAIEDFMLTPQELEGIAQARRQATERLDLKQIAETVKSTSLDTIKAHTVSFLRSSNEGTYLGRVASREQLQAGRRYTVDFAGNAFAQRKANLAMLSKWIPESITRLTVKTPQGNKIAERIDGVFNGKKSYGEEGYVEILDNYEIILPKTSAQVESKEKSYNDNYTTQADAFEDAYTSNVEASQIPRGAMAARPAGSVYKGSERPQVTPQEAASDVTGASYESFDHLSNRASARVTLNEEFKNMSAIAVVRSLRKAGNRGEAVYQEIDTLAKLRTKFDRRSDVDNENMYEKISRFLFFEQGQLTAAEMCRKTYGKNLKKTLEEYNALKSNPSSDPEKLQDLSDLLGAIDTIIAEIGHVDLSKAVEAEAKYKAMRENLNFTGDAKKRADFTEIFFDRTSYGPVAQRSLWETIRYNEDRANLGQDNWQSREARWQGRRFEHRNRGENEIISHSTITNQLDALQSDEAYLKQLNTWRLLGEAHINAMAKVTLTALPGNRFERKVSTQEITSSDLEDSTNILGKRKRDLIRAIRHGAMIEAETEKREFDGRSYEDILLEQVSSGSAELTTEEIENIETVPNSPAMQEIIQEMEASGEYTDAMLEKIKGEGNFALFLATIAALEWQSRFGEDGSTDLEGLKAALGVHALVGGRFTVGYEIEAKSEYDESGNSISTYFLKPVLTDHRLSTSYTSKRLGKKQKVRLGAYGNLNESLVSGTISPTTGINVAVDWWEGSALSSRAGLYYNLESGVLTADLKVIQRDFQRLAAHRYKKWLQSKGVQKRLTKAREQLHTDIEAMDLDVMDKKTRQLGSFGYMLMELEQEWMERFANPFIPRAGGLGAVASFDAEEIFSQGLRPSLQNLTGLSFAIHGDAVMGRGTTRFISPDEESHYDIRGERVESTGEVKAVEQRFEAIPGYIFYSEEGLAAAQARAAQESEQLVEDMNTAMGENIELSYGDELVSINLKSSESFPVDGFVTLAIDQDSDIRAVDLGGGDVGLDLDRDMGKISIQVERESEGYGTNNRYVIFISNKENAQYDPEEEYESISWVQSIDGQKAQAELHTVSGRDHRVMSKSDFDAAGQYGDLSRKGSENQALAFTRDHLETYRDLYGTRKESVEAKLFDELDVSKSKLDEIIKAVMERDKKDRGFDFNQLISAESADVDRVNEVIAEECHKAGIAEAKITQDLIYEVRGLATIATRKEHKAFPEKFSYEYAKSLLPEAAANLWINFMEQNKERIHNQESGITGFDVPAGAEMKIAIAVKKDMTTTREFYIPENDGEAIAAIPWGLDEDSAKETLNYLGAPKTPANVQAVIAGANAILNQEWPDTPFNTLQEETFLAAANTIVGEQLLNIVGDIFPEDATDILAAANEGRELSGDSAEAFLKIVKEVLETGHALLPNGGYLEKGDTVVGTAHCDVCDNPENFKYTPVYYYPPEKKALSLASSVQGTDRIYNSKEYTNWKQVRIPLGVPGIIMGTPVGSETGDGTRLTRPEGIQDLLGENPGTTEDNPRGESGGQQSSPMQ